MQVFLVLPEKTTRGQQIGQKVIPSLVSTDSFCSAFKRSCPRLSANVYYARMKLYLSTPQETCCMTCPISYSVAGLTRGGFRHNIIPFSKDFLVDATVMLSME